MQVQSQGTQQCGEDSAPSFFPVDLHPLFDQQQTPRLVLIPGAQAVDIDPAGSGNASVIGPIPGNLVIASDLSDSHQTLHQGFHPFAKKLCIQYAFSLSKKMVNVTFKFNKIL